MRKSYQGLHDFKLPKLSLYLLAVNINKRTLFWTQWTILALLQQELSIKTHVSLKLVAREDLCDYNFECVKSSFKRPNRHFDQPRFNVLPFICFQEDVPRHTHEYWKFGPQRLLLRPPGDEDRGRPPLQIHCQRWLGAFWRGGAPEHEADVRASGLAHLGRVLDVTADLLQQDEAHQHVQSHQRSTGVVFHAQVSTQDPHIEADWDESSSGVGERLHLRISRNAVHCGHRVPGRWRYDSF